MAGGLNEKEVSRCSTQTTGKQKPKGQENWQDETDFFVSVMLRVKKIEAYARIWLLKICMESELTKPLKSWVQMCSPSSNTQISQDHWGTSAPFVSYCLVLLKTLRVAGFSLGWSRVGRDFTHSLLIWSPRHCCSHRPAPHRGGYWAMET